MAQVNVVIDGKSYRMACDPGQEEHLESLAAKFDKYVGHLKSSFGEIGDQRLTVMAGIMRVKGIETEMESLRKTRDDALTKADKKDDKLVERLSNVAENIEALATKLG
ncbi:hypothetical protein GQR58_029527 [Nymphon striatum]|nr:hypothetical protein GQR58_029527 [Nymphon striatum]